jgi:beta-glucosidase
MTLDEKIGQMTQADREDIKDLNDIIKYGLGSLLNGGDSAPGDRSPAEWVKMYDAFQQAALNSRLKIPLLYGIDAVHGDNGVRGAVVFPHNIGIGCTRDAKLAEQAARITAEEIAGTGINWAFAPCIAVPQDEHWGRTYEGFGETVELQKLFAPAEVLGFQTDNLASKTAILACAKHFVADGGTKSGIDQGDADLDEQTIRALHLPGYIEAMKAGVGTVMASYSSIKGLKMHGSKYWLTDVLKNELGFKGFIISDWQAIDQLAKDYKTDIEISVNAGIDMVMVPHEYVKFITLLKELVNEKKIPLSRIDDAVSRILTVKFAMGLFDHCLTDKSLTASIGSPAHREVARECVRKSLVLLKNDGHLLPLQKDIKSLFIAGDHANDLGRQCGGWTMSWQGHAGKITDGTTILDGIKAAIKNSGSVTYSVDGKNAAGHDVAIVVVGEEPYAETKGNVKDLSLSKKDRDLIQKVTATGVPTIVILISGRPMIITDELPKAKAFVAAWLPGSEGEGIADVLFGDYNFSGKLSHSWPKKMEDIPVNFGDKKYDPLFPYGFGLSY